MRTVVWPPRKSDSPDTRTGSGFLLFACPATRAPYFSIRFGAGLCLRSGTASRAVYRSEPASGQCLFRGLFRTIHLGLFFADSGHEVQVNAYTQPTRRSSAR